MAKLKIGFIGCGMIANQKHFPGMSQNGDDVELAAFCDILAERAEKGAKEYGAPGARVYVDYRELLADKSIDAVHVLTPNVAHAEISVAALEAGKHVLCEKPMAATYADAKRMADAAKSSGKLLTIGYQYRHFMPNAIMKRAVDEGLVGDIYYAEASAVRRRGVPTWGVFTNKALQGGGPLIDVGTHSLDLALWMMNNYEPVSVTGVSYEKLGRLLDPSVQDNPNAPWDNRTFEVEDSAMGFIRMKNGAAILLRAAWALNMAEAPSPVLLCGTRGGLDIKDGVVRVNSVCCGQQAITWLGSPFPRVDDAFSDTHVSKEAALWVKALKGESELFVKPEQALTVTRILDAVYRSTSIIYYSAVIGIDHDLIEASTLDGATKIKQIVYIILPQIKPVIITMVLLAIGRIFYSDFGLFYQVPMNSGPLYPTTNVIDTYVYRALLELNNTGMASAAGLYQSCVGFALVLLSNFIVRKMSPENALF